MRIHLLLTVATVLSQLFGSFPDGIMGSFLCWLSPSADECQDSASRRQSDPDDRRQPDPADQCVEVEPEFEQYYDPDSTISLAAIEQITLQGYLYRDELISLAGGEPTCRIQGSAGFTREDGSQFNALIYGWRIEEHPDRFFLAFVHPAHGDYLASFDYIPNLAEWREISTLFFPPMDQPLVNSL